MIGLHSLLEFATAVGAIIDRERDALWARGRAAFRGGADAQAEGQLEADPIARFPEQLASLVSSGDGYFATRDGDEPRSPFSPEFWGWVGRPVGKDEVNWTPRGRKLGWVGDGMLYLDRESVYAGLAELVRKQGQSYPLSPGTLWRRLKDKGLIARTDGERSVYPVTIEGSPKRVVHLRIESVFALPDPVSRFPNPGYQEPDGQAGDENGANCLEKPGFIPLIPEIPVSGTEERSGTRTPPSLFPTEPSSEDRYERAAIMEIDGGLPRAEAEQLAQDLH